MNNNTELLPILLESAGLILIILLILATLYGLILLLSPPTGLRLNRLLSHPFSTRQYTQPLDRQFHVERYFYRHAKLYGLLLIIGAGYLLYRLFLDFPLENYAQTLPDFLSQNAWAWLLEAARIFLILATLFTLLIGLVVAIRPSNIKSLEQRTNRWVSTREKLAFMSQNLGGIDNMATRAPRVFGGVVFLLGLVLLFVLF